MFNLIYFIRNNKNECSGLPVFKEINNFNLFTQKQIFGYDHSRKEELINKSYKKVNFQFIKIKPDYILLMPANKVQNSSSN